MSHLEAISMTVHQALRAWCSATQQRVMPDWGEAPEWMRDSTRESVQFVIDNPESGAGAQHDQWMQQKIRDGWVYGAERDDDQKRHPSLVAFVHLPENERKKDKLVCAIVGALR